MVRDVLNDLEKEYKSVLGDLKRSLSKIRTGRANLAMLDGITVEYYGTEVPLNQVATLQVADARLITIQPWEESMIPKIEKAIMQSELGLNPSDDGSIIRVPIPALSEERREELVDVVNDKAEDHKISIRNLRRKANDQVEQLEKDSDISEDQMHRGFDQIDELTQKYTDKIDARIEQKKEEIREV